MAFNSLYRRFRPETFEEVIGQDHIVRTLVNQIKNNAVGHAYLFTGTRGTGKTSVAKIFSRAVNCENNVGGSPCDKCETCLELKLSSNFDILEIDAASNNSVELMRDLTEKINFPPTVGRYKVYIIDEVHMLSKSAFNALLKTLEEPPQHAIFILATTEAQSIPATIMSRCLRFDFRLVPNELIVNHLKEIFKEVGAQGEEEAFSLIASAATGSVRDALSIADMCISYCSGNVTYEGVLDVLGASDPKKLLDLAADMLCSDTDATLKKISELCDLGKSVRILTYDLASIFRNVLFIKNCSNSEDILKLPKDLFEKLRQLSQSVSNARLLHAITVLNSLEASYRTSSQHRIIFEAAALKIALFDEGARNGQGGADQKTDQKLKRFENAPQGASGAASANSDGADSVQKKNTVNNIDKYSSAKQLWNYVTSKLDPKTDECGESVNTLLFWAATAGEPTIENDALVVWFPAQATVDLLSQKQNRDKLNAIFSEISPLKLKFSVRLKIDDNNAVNYVKSMFGDDVVIR
jgi:DNA polymerase III subunit gamma/tau